MAKIKIKYKYKGRLRLYVVCLFCTHTTISLVYFSIFKLSSIQNFFQGDVVVMRSEQKFTVAELEQIGKSKHRLMRIQLLERHLENLEQRRRQIKAELGNLGYRGAKLSPLNGNGCKPHGCGTIRRMLIEEKLDELREIEREIDKVKEQLKKIVKTLHKMPTKIYADILIKMYVTRAKTTQRDWNLRNYHLDDAYLEFYHTWHN